MGEDERKTRQGKENEGNTRITAIAFEISNADSISRIEECGFFLTISKTSSFKSLSVDGLPDLVMILTCPCSLNFAPILFTESGAVFTFGRSRFADNVPSHFYIRNDPVVEITCGDEHTAVICQKGRVFVFGNNDFGQLGLGHKNVTVKPSCVKSLKPERAVHIACGRAHTLVSTGQMSAFDIKLLKHCHNEVETLAHVLGSCPHDEALQNATHHQVRSIIATALKDADYNTFEEVHGLSVTGSTRRIDIIAFKESTRSGFIIGPTVRFETNEEQPAEVDKEKKNIYNPTIPYCLQKYQLEELEVIGLLVGARESGKLFAWGNNSDGQLGVGDIADRAAPTRVVGIHSDIAQLSAGCLSSAALTVNGQVYVWGSNSDGQLGLPETSECLSPVLLPFDQRIVHISCGYYHTAFVTESGALYTCGESESGKLGLPDSLTNITTPQKVTLAVPVKSVYCGGNHTIALTVDGEVYAFGNNFNGQLGLGAEVTQFILPTKVISLEGLMVTTVSCGESHTAFVTDRGGLYTCGESRHGKLCNEQDNNNQSVPVPMKASKFKGYMVAKPDRSHLVPVAWQQWSEMEALIPSPAACEVRSVIKFFNAQNIAPIEIHRQLCQVYGPNIMSKQMVRHWCRQFSEGRQSVHSAH
ncbi:hypothetical protein ANN_20338 [Periplaneta americana]|uniref:Uncharacterized protein n=1 Tax=Periplaneta americana TaxID=6978 RepID=A0ABQ8SDH0_PERAM|nr:hypothetical protein ANN_20338 [Periplaneta americana]